MIISQVLTLKYQDYISKYDQYSLEEQMYILAYTFDINIIKSIINGPLIKNNIFRFSLLKLLDMLSYYDENGNLTRNIIYGIYSIRVIYQKIVMLYTCNYPFQPEFHSIARVKLKYQRVLMYIFNRFGIDVFDREAMSCLLCPRSYYIQDHAILLREYLLMRFNISGDIITMMVKYHNNGEILNLLIDRVKMIPSDLYNTISIHLKPKMKCIKTYYDVSVITNS